MIFHHGFEITELFRTDSSGTWLEKESIGFDNDSASFNPEQGEIKKLGHCIGNGQDGEKQKAADHRNLRC